MGALPYKKTATTDAAWDAAANLKRIKDGDTAALREMHAWVDPKGDPKVKSSYKLPHHEVSAEGKVGAANTHACSAAIAALNGGRGGVDIPAGDRQAVYNTLAKHLKDAGKDAPELKSDSAVIGLERRQIAIEDLELRDIADGDGKGKKIVGYAAVYNKPSRISTPWGKEFDEQIAPGAFDDTCANDDIRALFNHNEDNILGRMSAGTLDCRSDSRGLRYEIQPPDSHMGGHVTEAVRRRDVTGSSFSFQIPDPENDQEWIARPDQPMLRVIKRAKVFDVGPVTFPAYGQTESGDYAAQMRSMFPGGEIVIPEPPEADKRLTEFQERERARAAEALRQSEEIAAKF